MSDLLLNFFIGGFENVLNPLTLQVEEITQKLNQIGLSIMTFQEQIVTLTATIDALNAASEAERGQVAGALGSLEGEVATLAAQVAELIAQAGLASPELDAQILRVNEAIAADSGIYEPAPVEPTV